MTGTLTGTGDPMRRTMTITALLGLALAGLMPPSPAAAASTATADVTSATVVARGAAVDVTTVVNCPAGEVGHLYFRITQRSGNGVAEASASGSVACTGEAQVVTLRATAQGGGAVFRNGTSLIVGELSTCDEWECEYLQISETVRAGR